MYSYVHSVYRCIIYYNIIYDCVSVTSTFEGVAKKAVAARCLADGRVRDARAPARSIRSSSHRRRSIRRQPSTITVPTDAITVGRLRLAAAVAAPPGHRPPTTASSAGWAPPPDDRRHRRQCRRHHRDPEVFFFYDLAGPRHQRRRIARAARTHDVVRSLALPSNVFKYRAHQCIAALSRAFIYKYIHTCV